VSYSAAARFGRASSPAIAAAPPSSEARRSRSSGRRRGILGREDRPRPLSAPSPEPTRTTPTRAYYAGRVGGGGGSVAVAVHGDKAIAYVCNGSTVEGWMRGKVETGQLVLTGKNQTHLTASYHAGKVTGTSRPTAPTTASRCPR
jgi:hypothetical protein